MSIPFDLECLKCHYRRNMETARRLEGDHRAFACDLMELYMTMPPQAASPWLSPYVTELLKKHFGLEGDRFLAEKQDSNRFVLERLDRVRSRVEKAPDPVYAGLQMAILGNYIDFSALQGQVSFQQLDELLDQAADMALDGEIYRALCADLKAGKRLLYLTDNAGEIGFDRVFAEQIQKAYPNLQITFCVRGGPAMNDATREDAAAVGLPFPVIDNGNTVPGTQLDQLSPQALDAVNGADVIISKGQGNTETLWGCGMNIYYAFLVKCPRFVNLFGKPKLTPMLVKETGQV